MPTNAKHILLINPPQKHAVHAGVDDEFVDIIGYYPPLGLLYLATVLNQKGYVAKIIDAVPMQMDYNDIIEQIDEFKPFMVGITTYTTSMVDVLKLAEHSKQILPQALVVLGGHHPTLYPKESAGYPNIDYILQGEAEETLVQLLHVLQNNLGADALKAIDGIGFKAGETIFVNPQKAFLKNLDNLPIIDRQLLPLEIYKSIVGRNSMVATVMSSRGCPFRCTFCFTPNKRYRSRSTENMVQEIKYLVALGFKEVFFFDDLFALKPQKVIEFSKRLRQENINIEWSFRARISTITEELVREVKQSGVHRIQFGIESGVDKTLIRIKKDTTRQQIAYAIALCRRYGIQTIGSFIIGLPDETAADMQQTIRFSRNIGLNYAQYNILIPYPFTAIYHEGLMKNVFTKDYWKEFADDPIGVGPNFKVQYWTEEVSEDYLFKTAKRAFKQFYFRPVIVWNKLKELRTRQEFKNAVVGAVSVLRFNARKH